jgi:hypothetical protein
MARVGLALFPSLPPYEFAETLSSTEAIEQHEWGEPDELAAFFTAGVAAINEFVIQAGQPVNALRVLQWLVWHLHVRDATILAKILAFCKHLRNSEHIPNCNTMEALWVFDRTSELARTAFSDLASLVFPILVTDGCFMRAQFNLFLRICRRA